MNGTFQLPLLIEKYEHKILTEWLKEQNEAVRQRRDLLKEGDLKNHSASFLRALCQATRSDSTIDIQRKEWLPVREILTDITNVRAGLGFSPSETATFVFSLKQPIFSQLQQEFASQTDRLFTEVWYTSSLIDKLGLYTTEIYQKVREQVISRQQQEMLELSMPVVKLWEGVLCIPMIGTLDSNRSQMVMESLLQAIVDQSADVAIIDITGVPTVDTLTAQHLLKAIAAARLMGAECIISGIRPHIAQTIVHLGIELHNIKTKATLAEALALALKHRGLGVRPLQDRKPL